VSATLLSAREVLLRAREVLEPAGVAYKCAASLGALGIINSGLPSYSQAGKFITVYCSDADQAVGLAAELDAATFGLAGPEVPYDLPFRTGGLVFYRYGSFAGTTIRDPRGRWRPDRREAGGAVPSWVANPFPQVAPGADDDGPIGLRFLVTQALAQRGKGGVYEALDLDAQPARLCILKEGRRHGETQWDGSDGFRRVGHEATALRDLLRRGVPVPQVLGEFEQGGNRYVALEKLDGEPLVRRRGHRTNRRPWPLVGRISREIVKLLQQIHDAGWVWRDCKPDNLLLGQDRIRPIDFEGACRIDETSVIPWGSIAYTPRHILAGNGRQAGWQEDDFAAAVATFQLGTGVVPSPSKTDWASHLLKARCPARLRDQLLSVLTPTPS